MNLDFCVLKSFSVFKVCYLPFTIANALWGSGETMFGRINRLSSTGIFKRFNLPKFLFRAKQNRFSFSKMLKKIVTSNSYTMGCPPVRGDNPRALASGLSYVQVDKHGITILCHLHQCRPCTSRDIPC